MADFKVVIVGGGLAGALLANGLRNNGVQVMVYERDRADSNREGYQIRLGPGSQAGFRACLTDDHIGKISAKLGKSSGAQATAPSLFNTNFQEIVDLTRLPTYSKSAGINRVVLRDILLEPIKKSGLIKYGKGFDHYEIITEKTGKEKVKLMERTPRLVQLGLNNIKLLDSHWAFLTKGNLPFNRMMSLPPKLRQGPVIVFAGSMSFYYALYLPEAEVADEHHKGANEKVALQYNESEASFYWGLVVPVDKISSKDVSEVKDHRKVCRDAIKDWAPEFHRMIDIRDDESGDTNMLVTQLRASTQPRMDWRLRAQEEGDGKGHPRVWVIGDAMHAMQPNRGQGGNQALADCADALPRLLHLNSLASVGPEHPTYEEVKDACEKYERAMIPRAFSWVRKSGGTSFPSINLDGFLGVVVHYVAKLVMPLLKLYLIVLPQKDEE
ncbi:unnamed protein product [Alternaria burnsii]|nr:unnamed protein product [Alternaria burnsii]